jgi:hypothetical protein
MMNGSALRPDVAWSGLCANQVDPLLLGGGGFSLSDLDWDD